MGAVDTVKSLMRAGVEFALDGERIVWRNSDGRMTPEIVALLRDERADVLGFLMRAAVPVAAPDPEPSTSRWLQLAQQAEPHVPPPFPASAPSQPDASAFPYGASPGGRPLTVTGRVVSLDAWRSLTDWEKHGARGRMWNGKAQRWENRA